MCWTRRQRDNEGVGGQRGDRDVGTYFLPQSSNSDGRAFDNGCPPKYSNQLSAWASESLFSGEK